MNSKHIVYRVGPRYSTGMKYEDLAKVFPMVPNGASNLTELLIKLNTLTDPLKLPTRISLDLAALENDFCPLSIENVISVVQNTADLAAIRMGQKPTRLIFHGHVHTSISAGLVEKLKKNQFIGMTCTIGGLGWEPCVEYNQDIMREHWIWPDTLINDNVYQAADQSTTGSIIRLTARQEEICHLIVHRGLSNKQIARHLSIGESAVKMHISILLSKYAVRSRSQLSAFLKNT